MSGKFRLLASGQVTTEKLEAATDGTHWDLYENNLLSERHIRYGGYGGLAYYHVSDTYIAFLDNLGGLVDFNS